MFKHIIAYGVMAGTLLLLVSACGIKLSEPAAKKIQNGFFSMTVFPVHVMHDKSYFDMRQTALIIDHINVSRIGKAFFMEDEPMVGTSWKKCRSKMFKSSAYLFQEYLKTHPIKTDYALLVEYLMSPGKETIVGIHYYLIDHNNNIAIAESVDPHSLIYKEMKPAGIDGCLSLFKKAFDEKIHLMRNQKK